MALSFPTHLIRVNSRFYYKIKVPADLSHLFPCSFIKKSLFTDQLHAAKTMLTSYEYRTHNAFALLRTGTLAQDVNRISNLTLIGVEIDPPIHS